MIGAVKQLSLALLVQYLPESENPGECEKQDRGKAPAALLLEEAVCLPKPQSKLTQAPVN